jgi:pimeloyl-ACP methyl ester carboxylesterase
VETAVRRIVLCLPDGMPPLDPSPADTAERDVDLAYEWDETAAGVVGWAEGGWTAFELAAKHGELVDRLVLVSTPPPETEDAELGAVTAKTLFLYGTRDGGNAHATWWKNRVGGRIEMVPGEGCDILERVWPRVLSHLAPGALRRQTEA